MKLQMIGFTKKSAGETPAGLCRQAHRRCPAAQHVAALRIREEARPRVSPKHVAGLGYEHVPLLAPSVELLDKYRKKRVDWDAYARGFVDLMRQRNVETDIDLALLEGGCLLCSEEKPHRCHRRLVAEYLNEHWGNVEVEHLG